eukprot:TRINITY_DN67110_c9_g3_i1.p1 TRINITY_DN67110_c9_g3~~TRINITY_DN67110_c9_g3_i1.p1  ORF type:complete len:631 (+),score=83.74 TRINITY_DN67110_c9_g3_i1:45-1937(+)
MWAAFLLSLLLAPWVHSDPITFPPEYRSSAGVLSVNLTVTTTELVTPVQIVTRTYNGAWPGPTLRVKPGDTLEVNLINALEGPPGAVPGVETGDPLMNTFHAPNVTNLHTHGLHVDPETATSDNPFVNVPPGTSYKYTIKIPANHIPGLFWYHPHKHGSAALQTAGGMAGLIVVEEDPTTQLPELAAMQEVLLVIQTIRLENGCATCKPFFNYDYLRGAMGDTIHSPTLTPAFQPVGATTASTYYLVNGQQQPTISVPVGNFTRLRVLNADPAGFMYLAITGCELYVLANDGYYTEFPRLQLNVVIGPGNRKDIAVRCLTAGLFMLTYQTPVAAAGATDPIGSLPQAAAGTVINLAEVLAEYPLSPLAFQVPTISFLPASLRAPQLTGQLPDLRILHSSTRMDSYEMILTGCEVGATLTPALDSSAHCINGRTYNASRTDYWTTIGTVNEWTIIDQEVDINHPFHIHTNPFQLIEASPGFMDTHLLGQYMDTVPSVPGGWIKIRFVPKDFTGTMVYHCHILQHEDKGMMANMEVRHSLFPFIKEKEEVQPVGAKQEVALAETEIPVKEGAKEADEQSEQSASGGVLTMMVNTFLVGFALFSVMVVVVTQRQTVARKWREYMGYQELDPEV